MPSQVNNHLAQLAKVERYIAQFQKLSDIHERTLAEHNNRLDYTWKEAFEAGSNQAKEARQAAANAAVDVEYSTKIQQLRLQLSMRKLTDEQRQFIYRMMEEDRFTLNEMMDEIRAEFPADCIPSRSALGREKKNFAAEAKEFREIAAASEVLVKEFGEDPDDKGGMLLAQAVQAVVTRRALDELTNDGENPEKPKMDIDDVGALARAARAAIMTKSKAMENRDEIRRQARDELLKEQDENLKKAAASQGMGEEQIQFWREKVLGIK